MASPSTPLPSLPLVIVGGGIQGLCLLRRAVESGIDAALFTKGAVGDGETLHSHALMSGGSWASSPAAATTCASSISALRKLVPASCFYDQATFMFIVDKVGPVTSSMDEAAMTKAWAAFNIPNKPMAESAVPALFRGEGPIKGKALYQSAVDGLYNDVAVVKALYEPLKDRIRRGELVNITLDESGKGVRSAAFKLPDGQMLTVRPTQLLLATGAWTVPIVHKTLTGASPSALSALQTQVTGRGLLMPMIIIRGKELPRVAGFAMSSGIIWGYSETEDGTPEWRCTPTSAIKVGPVPYGPAFDHTHPACPLAEVRNAVHLLETLIPGFGGIKTSLRFAYYADYRTEHPTSHDRPPLPTVLALNSSLRVVLPGLWQHATTTAQTVISDLQKHPSFSSHAQSVHTVAAAPVATVAPRKVDTLTFMSYEELTQKLASL